MYAQNEQFTSPHGPVSLSIGGAAYALGRGTKTTQPVRLYAAEGQCFVLAPCAIVSKEMHELAMHRRLAAPIAAAWRRFSRGFYGPDGAPLGNTLPENEEGIIYADKSTSE